MTRRPPRPPALRYRPARRTDVDTLAEMALAGGHNTLSREASGIGVELFPYEGKLPAHAIWFGEDQGRYVVEVTPAKAEEIIERARLLELPARIAGRTVASDAQAAAALSLKGEKALPLSELRATHEAWLPELMKGEVGV